MLNYYSCISCITHYKVLDGDLESGTLGLFMTYSMAAHADMELYSTISCLCPLMVLISVKTEKMKGRERKN